MELARRAENDFVGAPTGILDQSASVLCTAGHALFLDTRDRTSEQVPLDLAAAGLALLVVDSGVAHEHAEGGYGDRRRECEEAAARLGVDLPARGRGRRRLGVLDDGTAEGEVLLRRARHIVTEDARVLEVVAALRGDADPRTIGPVLTAGHESLRDDFEISVPLLDAIVEPPWRPVPTGPAWSAAGSAAAPSRSSRPTPSTRSPPPSPTASRARVTPRPAPSSPSRPPGARRLA